MLFTMIYSYANRGCIDEFLKRTPLVDVTFQIIRAQLDRDREKYEKICLRNAENAKFGGRPKTQKTQSVFEKPRKPYNDNKNNNYSDSDTDTDTDNDNKFGTMRSFDSEDFFAAALARSYGEEEKEKEEEKEEDKAK